MLVCAVAALVTGPLSEIYGRRPFLLGGLCLIGLGSLTVAVAPTFPLALLGRAAGGFGFVMAVALALAGDSFQGGAATELPPDARRRSTRVGRWRSDHRRGYAAGRLAELAGRFGLLALALAVLAAFFLLTTEPIPGQDAEAGSLGHLAGQAPFAAGSASGAGRQRFAQHLLGRLHYLRRGLLRGYVRGCDLAACADSRRVRHRLHRGHRGGGRLVSRLGPVRLTAIGCGSAALLLAVLPQISLLKASLIVVTASCVFSGAANSALIAWILRLASEQRGATLALNSALTNLGAALGAAACGAGALLLGYTGLGLASASLAVLAAGAAAWSAARGAGSATCAAIRS